MRVYVILACTEVSSLKMHKYRLDELSIAGLSDSEFVCFDMNGDNDEILDFEDDGMFILISYFDAQILNIKVT